MESNWNFENATLALYNDLRGLESFNGHNLLMEKNSQILYAVTSTYKNDDNSCIWTVFTEKEKASYYEDLLNRYLKMSMGNEEFKVKVITFIPSDLK